MFFFIDINVFASSQSNVVMDVESGRILYQNNANKSHLIASTTKIMTALIVLENSDLDKNVVVGDEVLKMYGTNIYIEVGERLSIRGLLYGLMLRSGNDAAITLAVNVSGSEKNFVNLMNRKALEIGMKNTNFSNPHGLDEETKNYSTASDMAKLARYAYKNPDFRKIIKTKKYNCKSSLKSYIWYNRVSILKDYKYSLGGKNGYTPSAGKCLVSFAKKDNMTLLAVTLNDGDIYNTQKILFNDYFNKYKLYKILDKNSFFYDDSLIDRKLYIKKSFSYPLTSDEVDKVYTTIKIGNNSREGVVGRVIVKLDNDVIGSVNLYERENKKKDISIFQRVLKFFKN